MQDMVIPELVVADVKAARIMLCDVFGFAANGPVLSLGTQSVALRQGQAAGHGVIDHLALSVPDVASAAAAMVARGAQVDMATTPDGPREVPEFWAGGVHYLFLLGPGGARIELCCNRAHPQPLGHDHIGIPCSDVAASMAFLAGVGGRVLSCVDLLRPQGRTRVRFVAVGGSVVELYAPPDPTLQAGPGYWSRLFLPGLTAELTGPDGLQLSPLPSG